MLDAPRVSLDTSAKIYTFLGVPKGKPKAVTGEIQQYSCLKLDDELFRLVTDYHRAMRSSMGERHPADTLRELIWMGITHNINTASLRQMQFAAMRNLEVWLLTEVHTSLTALRKKLAEQVQLRILELQAAATPEEIATQQTLPRPQETIFDQDFTAYPPPLEE